MSVFKSYVYCYNYESSFITLKYVRVKGTVAELYSSADEHYNKTLVTRFSRVCTRRFRKFAGLRPEYTYNSHSLQWVGASKFPTTRTCFRAISRDGQAA
jgi:hypothetical protein